MGSLYSCVSNFSNKVLLKDWNCRTATTDILNLEENCLWRESASRYSDTKYTRVGRKDELKSHESTNSLFERNSVMRQNKVNFTNARNARTDAFKLIQGNFKKWNRITAFPINQQRFQVLVPCWAATHACHLTHGIRLDHKKTILVSKFLFMIRPKIIIKEFIQRHQEWQDQFHKRVGQGPLSQERKSEGHNSNADICMKAVNHELQISCGFSRVLWLESKHSRYRNCNSTSSLHLFLSHLGR